MDAFEAGLALPVRSTPFDATWHWQYIGHPSPSFNPSISTENEEATSDRNFLSCPTHAFRKMATVAWLHAFRVCSGTPSLALVAHRLVP